MLLFGWGTKSKQWTIHDNQLLLCRWRYFSLFFFPLAFNKTWYILGEKRNDEREIGPLEAEQLLGGDRSIGLWNQYGLLFLLGTGFLAIILGN